MLNLSQQKIYKEAIDWWFNKDTQTFEISGPPGSGKTFLTNEIIKALGVNRDRIAPMAYTGAAAINMRTKGMENAKTCFAWLYKCYEVPMYDEKGMIIIDPVFNRPKTKLEFVPNAYLEDIDLIVIDEAGMIPLEMRKVIDSMNIPVIAVGDLDQLPSIASTPGYLTDPSKVHILTEIVRQEANNTIIKFSQMALKGIDIPIGHHGNVYAIYDDQLTNDIIAKSKIIICGKNDTRDYMINKVRKEIIGVNSPLPIYGERVVCRKNNWNISNNGISLTNGLLGNVMNYPDISLIDRKRMTYTLSFKPDIINSVFEDLEADYRYITADYKARNNLKNNKFCFGEKFEFGYAITTHMSQGSEFDSGIYIEEYLNHNINRNLNYVGLTRFKRLCIYVKHRPKKYYNGYRNTK